MSTFLTRIEEVKANVTNKGFSRTDFNSLIVAYMNDVDFETESYKAKGETVEITKKTPVKSFRKMIKAVLIELGIGAKEAEAAMASYQFKNADAMYDFMNEFIYHYMKTGRKYKLGEKEDFAGSIFLKERGEVVKKNKKGENIKHETYYSLGQQSSCPKWKKKQVDDKGKVLKELSKVFK